MGTWLVFDSERAPNQFMLDAYFQALDEFTTEQIEYAFSVAIKTLKFFPRPVELLEILNGPQNLIEDTAQVQAGIVLNTIKRVGGGQSVSFEDPVTTAVINNSFGGWVQLCSTLKSDQEGWFLKDFSKAYQIYTRQGMKEIGHLPGRIEINNTARGFYAHVPAPIEIGDFEGKPNRIEH
jgi:hypothetical protein